MTTTANQLLALLKLNPSDTVLVNMVNDILQHVGNDVSDAEKIAAYDRIAKKIGQVWGQNDEACDGVIYESSDNSHYLVEEVLEAVLGDNIFDAWNEIFEGC